MGRPTIKFRQVLEREESIVLSCPYVATSSPYSHAGGQRRRTLLVFFSVPFATPPCPPFSLPAQARVVVGMYIRMYACMGRRNGRRRKKSVGEGGRSRRRSQAFPGFIPGCCCFSYDRKSKKSLMGARRMGGCTFLDLGLKFRLKLPRFALVNPNGQVGSKFECIFSLCRYIPQHPLDACGNRGSVGDPICCTQIGELEKKERKEKEEEVDLVNGSWNWGKRKRRRRRRSRRPRKSGENWESTVACFSAFLLLRFAA